MQISCDRMNKKLKSNDASSCETRDVDMGRYDGDDGDTSENNKVQTKEGKTWNHNQEKKSITLDSSDSNDDDVDDDPYTKFVETSNIATPKYDNKKDLSPHTNITSTNTVTIFKVTDGNSAHSNTTVAS